MTTDSDLDELFTEAIAQWRQKRKRKKREETHEDYAKRLAEKALFRRLSREANAQIDALRFEWWFLNEGAEGLTLDQWRAFIDIQMERSQCHPKEDLMPPDTFRGVKPNADL